MSNCYQLLCILGSRHQRNLSPNKYSVGVRPKSLSESQFQGPLKKSMLEKSSSPRNVKFCSTPEQTVVQRSKCKKLFDMI